MATATPSQPDSEQAARIVGERLEADLVEAGVTQAAARAIHHALELVVLRLLLVMATKQDVRDTVDGLRREVEGRFRSIDQQFEEVDRRFDGVDRRFDEHDRRFDAVESAISELRRELRWGFGILFTAIIGLMIALLARGM